MSLERLLGIFVNRRSLQSTVVASLYVDCGVNQGLISQTQSCGHSLLCMEDSVNEFINNSSTNWHTVKTTLTFAMLAREGVQIPSSLKSPQRVIPYQAENVKLDV